VNGVTSYVHESPTRFKLVARECQKVDTCEAAEDEGNVVQQGASTLHISLRPTRLRGSNHLLMRSPHHCCSTVVLMAGALHSYFPLHNYMSHDPTCGHSRHVRTDEHEHAQHKLGTGCGRKQPKFSRSDEHGKHLQIMAKYPATETARETVKPVSAEQVCCVTVRSVRSACCVA
jgi:hypothetical protein